MAALFKAAALLSTLPIDDDFDQALEQIAEESQDHRRMVDEVAATSAVELIDYFITQSKILSGHLTPTVSMYSGWKESLQNPRYVWRLPEIDFYDM